MAKRKVIDYHLTKRERDVLTILWNSDDGLIASQVAEGHEDLTINTVQAVLKKLLHREFIKVQDIVYSGTVLSRKYCPTVSEEEFTVAEITQNIYDLERFGITPAKFFAEFIDRADINGAEAKEMLEVLENM